MHSTKTYNEFSRNNNIFDSVLVDCEFGPWSEGPCNATCGTSATKIMSRKIIQKAENGGKTCKGDTTESKNCELAPCPSTKLYIYRNYDLSVFKRF